MKALSVTLPPGQPARLADIDPAAVDGDWTKDQARRQVDQNASAIGELCYRLYAENLRALLVVLQGMDTAGKDGTIRHVMTAIDPQCCCVTPFKQPTAEELSHDFLWRIHRQTPRHGTVGVFNRSQYEDVVIVRVHELVPEPVWRPRYDRINEFERLLAEGRTTILKFFLHISREEQRERLQARLDDPNKRWKFSRQDIEERKHWDDYQVAYEDAISHCNTEHAPWHIVPADRKWYRDLVVSQVLLETLQKMDPQFPPAEEGLDEIVIE